MLSRFFQSSLTLFLFFSLFPPWIALHRSIVFVSLQTDCKRMVTPHRLICFCFCFIADWLLFKNWAAFHFLKLQCCFFLLTFSQRWCTFSQRWCAFSWGDTLFPRGDVLFPWAWMTLLHRLIVDFNFFLQQVFFCFSSQHGNLHQMRGFFGKVFFTVFLSGINKKHSTVVTEAYPETWSHVSVL